MHCNTREGQKKYDIAGKYTPLNKQKPKIFTHTIISIHVCTLKVMLSQLGCQYKFLQLSPSVNYPLVPTLSHVLSLQLHHYRLLHPHAPPCAHNVAAPLHSIFFHTLHCVLRMQLHCYTLSSSTRSTACSECSYTTTLSFIHMLHHVLRMQLHHYTPSPPHAPPRAQNVATPLHSIFLARRYSHTEPCVVVSHMQ